MTTPNTTPEAVAALVAKHRDLSTFFRHTGDAENMEMHGTVVATLEALVKERDEARSDATKWQGLRESAEAAITAERKMRDDLRARLEEGDAGLKAVGPLHERCWALEQQLTAAQARVQELEAECADRRGYEDQIRAREARLREALEQIVKMADGMGYFKDIHGRDRPYLADARAALARLPLLHQSQCQWCGDKGYACTTKTGFATSTCPHCGRAPMEASAQSQEQDGGAK